MSKAQTAKLLRAAMERLEQAEALVKQALGDTDAGVDLRHSIGDAIEDVMYDIIELENA